MIAALSLSMALQLAAPSQVSKVETGSIATSSASAVRSDEANGYRVAPDESTDAGTMILRGVLFVPRALTFVVFAPFRGLLWLLETYEIPEFLTDVFYNDARTFGVFPTLSIESGFGIGGGARMVVQDVLAEDTRLKLSAGYGGRFRQKYKGELSTGKLIADWFELGAEGGWEDRPKDFYFAVGADAGSEEVRIQRTRGQAVGFARIHPTDFLRITLSGLYTHWDVTQSDEDPNANLDAFRPHLDLAYQEVYVELDTRRPASEMIAESTPSSGVYLGASAGITEVLTDPATRYWRWSAEGEWLIDLMHGDRVLALRGYVESVTGTLEDVPLVELPQLGGPKNLRGYQRDRFRDRALTLVSAEYRFPIADHALGYIFVDGGRVFRTLEEFSFNEWGLGFGGGVNIYTDQSSLVCLQAAGSRDGDFIFSLVFGGDFDHDPRSER